MSAFLFLIIMGVVAADASASRASVSKVYGKNSKVMQNTFGNPDFAFPETVGANAEAALKTAVDSGDDVSALRAAMQIAISGNLVSKENYGKGIRLFEELATKLRQPYSQLAVLLEAQMYCSIYNSTPWVFNNRAIPVEPAPENVMEYGVSIYRLMQSSAKLFLSLHGMFSYL